MQLNLFGKIMLTIVTGFLCIALHSFLIASTEDLVASRASVPFVPLAHYEETRISQNETIFNRMMIESDNRIKSLEASIANNKRYETYKEKYITPTKAKIDTLIHIVFAIFYVSLVALLIVLLRRQVQELKPVVGAKLKSLEIVTSAGISKLKDMHIAPDRKLEIAAKELENAKRLHADGVMSDAALEAKKNEIRTRLGSA